MNVLIVDDQISVVNGIVSGIKWEELSVTQIWKAYHAEEARQIIKSEHVDLLLCDIEMPEENGLALFRWIKQEQYQIECIFLTAHADFTFAREAIQLGGFDYILQPARYEEVQAAIVRAQQKMIARTETQKYSAYGKVLYSQKDVLINGLLKKLFFDENINQDTILKNLQRFQIQLSIEKEVAVVLIHIIRQANSNIGLEGELLGYTFQNVISELLDESTNQTLLTQSKKEDYIMLVYTTDGAELQREKIQNKLEEFLDIIQKLFEIELACYVGENIPLPEIYKQIIFLEEQKIDNVALQRKVFVRKSENVEQRYLYSYVQMKHWEQLLLGEGGNIIRKEAYQFLENKNLNSQMLKRFYHDFMKVLAKAEEKMGISTYQIFHEKVALEKSLLAYESIDTMKELVDYVVESFACLTRKNDSNYVESVIQYINTNIEKDIRRSEIAKIVNLNEDYLSRIFKNEIGMSLKEFIIAEKMKVAKNLLINTNFSVGTIAAKVGFDNFSHFSQMYKKTMGNTPAEERNSR